MTSIHASIPSELIDSAKAAKRRGEDPRVSVREDQEPRPTIKGKSASSSCVIMKKLPSRLVSIQSAPASRASISPGEHSEGSADEKSASKGNDPLLSPSPIPIQDQGKSSLTKSTLSDLPCPTDSANHQPSLNPSLQNIANNVQTLNSFEESQSAESNLVINISKHRLQEPHAGRTSMIALGDAIADECARSAKRVCSEEGKENALAGESRGMSTKPEATRSIPLKVQHMNLERSLAPSARGTSEPKGAKRRVGLRRL